MDAVVAELEENSPDTRSIELAGGAFGSSAIIRLTGAALKNKHLNQTKIAGGQAPYLDALTSHVFALAAVLVEGVEVLIVHPLELAVAAERALLAPVLPGEVNRHGQAQL